MSKTLNIPKIHNNIKKQIMISINWKLLFHQVMSVENDDERHEI